MSNGPESYARDEKVGGGLKGPSLDPAGLSATAIKTPRGVPARFRASRAPEVVSKLRRLHLPGFVHRLPYPLVFVSPVSVPSRIRSQPGLPPRAGGLSGKRG